MATATLYENVRVRPSMITHRFALPIAAFFLCFGLAKTMAAPGDLDTTFNGTGKVITAIGGSLYGGGYDIARGVVVQADGKIVVAGSTNDDGAQLIALTRYQTGGSLDPTFGTGGIVKSDISFGASQSQGYAVALQSDGKIVVAGSSGSYFAVARYTTSGALDATFGTGGVVTTTDFGFLNNYGNGGAYAVAVQSDGKIVAAGQYQPFNGKYVFVVARYNANGSLDTTFNTSGFTGAFNGSGTCQARGMAIQSDGAIVVVGTGWDGIAGHTDDFFVTRFTSAGKLDSTFNSSGIVSTDLLGSDQALAVAIQSNGAIVVTGRTHQGAAYDTALVRYTPAGALDLSFNGTGKVITSAGPGDDAATCVRIQSDGRILAGGSAINTITSEINFALLRFGPNGAPDTSFGVGGKVLTAFGSGHHQAQAMTLQTDGKIILAGSTGYSSFDFGIARYLDGSQVATTLPATNVTSSGATMNGSVTASTAFASVSFQYGPTISYGSSVGALPDTVNAGATVSVSRTFFILPPGTYHYRLRVQSTLGTTFGADATFTIPETNAWLASITPSVGTLTPIFNRQRLSYALNISGSVTTVAFRPIMDGHGATIRLNGGTIIPSGQFSGPVGLMGGYNPVTLEVTAQDGVTRKIYTIAVFCGETGPGGLDGLFGTAGINAEGGLFSADASAVAITSDGKIVTVGLLQNGAENDLLISRFNADGSPDATFSGSGNVLVGFNGTSEAGHGVAVQSDGKIVAVGEAEVSGFKQFIVIRYLPEGDPDLDFGGTGYVLTNIGTGDDRALSVALQPDGKIVVAGSSSDPDFFEQKFTVVRYNTNGSLDTTFNGTGVVTTAFDVIDSICEAYSVLVQPDGKIVLAGALYTSITQFALARYNANGSLDTTFNSTGMVTTSLGNGGYAIGRQAAHQADGKILVTGYVFNNGGYDFGLVRYNPNGSLDTTFNTTGKVLTDFAGRHDYAESVAIDAMGMIVVGGWSKNTIDFSSDFAIARYNPNGSPDQTFIQLGQPLAAGQVLTTISPTYDDVANAIAIQPDGKIIAAGYTSDAVGTHHIALVRYHGYWHREAWRMRYFGSTSGAGNAAFDIDPDHDGLPNLLEYAFGLDPMRGSSSELPQWSDNGTEYYLDFTEPFGIYGITYGAEWSTTMAPLDWHPVPDTGTNGRHFFVVPVDGNEKLFFRMKLTGLGL